MNKSLNAVLIAALLLATWSCATLFKGTTEDVIFSSNPDPAEVWVNGAKLGVTPCTLNLETKQRYTIEFRKEGFKTEIRNLTNHVGAGWIVLDVVAGLVPVIVDAATGAWYTFDQKTVDAMLKKQQP
ncbi:MAG: PEGA domain-containing protein [Candidatus Aminicenantes bacterium]|nr:PEGA domain-containing protein [Candidatus Aminicenantes bacterium]